jgi:hypothetical protein
MVRSLRLLSVLEMNQGNDWAGRHSGLPGRADACADQGHGLAMPVRTFMDSNWTTAVRKNRRLA